MKQAAKAFLSMRIETPEDKLLKIAMIAFILPFILYIGSILYVVIRYFNHTPMDMSDVVVGYYAMKQTPVIKRRLTFKK